MLRETPCLGKIGGWSLQLHLPVAFAEDLLTLLSVDIVAKDLAFQLVRALKLCS